MEFRFVAAIAASLFCIPAASAASSSAMPGNDTTGGNIKMLYHVDPVAQCSQAARDGTNLRPGLVYCNEALRDPAMIRRGALLLNRGIIKFALNDTQGALADFNAGLTENPQLGDGYVNRAALLITLKRYDEARADIAKAMELGASNMPVAYYNRAVIEDETGDYLAAYRDYSQALALNPDYAAAARELARFKRTALNAPAIRN
ncbi:MAG TPA: tetratricopeptide repeat protein [Rhizomicrobium sp.]|nr:tetratricopeptide repeat protein [Rhizomicrobium sp.]